MAGYQALPDGSEGAYGRLVANVEGQLQIITRATAAVRGGIGQSSDSAAGHAVAEASKQGTASAKSARQLLGSDFRAIVSEASGAERSRRAAKRSSLQKEYKMVVDAFQGAVKEATAAHRRIGGRGPSASAPVVQGEGRDVEAQGTGQLLSGGDVDYTRAVMREREAEAKRLATDLVDLQETMADLQGMVAEQHDMVAEVGDNADAALGNTDKGVKHLTKAAEYQKGFTSRLVWFIVIVLVLAGGVTAAVVLTQKHK